MVRSRSVQSTHSGAMSRPSPISSTVCQIIATGNSSSDQFACAPANTAKSTSTGIAKVNSRPLVRMTRTTQIDRGIAVERISRASFLTPG